MCTTSSRIRYHNYYAVFPIKLLKIRGYTACTFPLFCDVMSPLIIQVAHQTLSSLWVTHNRCGPGDIPQVWAWRPPGCGPGDPPHQTPQLPPWVWAWRPPRPDHSTSPWVWAWRPFQPRPQNFPLGVGLETPPPRARPLNLPPGCGPGDLQGMLGYHPLHLLEHITFANFVCGR